MGVNNHLAVAVLQPSKRPAPELVPGWTVVQLESGTFEGEQDALQWAYANVTDWQWSPYLGGDHDELGLHLQFKDPNDALLFKLTWAGMV